MSRNIATIPPEKPTTLRFIDLATKQKFGPCCVEAMKFTDHMLTIHGRRAGIVHPGDPTPNTY